MPFQKTVERATFEDLGAPEYWFEYTPMGSMKYSDFLRMNDISLDESLSDLQKACRKIALFVVDWNIPIDEENSESDILPLPCENSSIVENMPALVVEKITEIVYTQARESGVTVVPLAEMKELLSNLSTSLQAKENGNQEEQNSELSQIDSSSST